MNSIRRNLLVALLGALCAAMLLGGWATYRAAWNEAGELFDYHLRQIALSLRDQRFEGSAERLAGDGNLDYVIRVWDRDGLTMFYSRPHDALPELTQLGYSTTATKEGAWRLYAIQYHGQTIAVAQPMRVRDRRAAEAAWQSLEPFLIMLPILGLLIWCLVGWGLRPLDRLARSVRTRTPDRLDPLPAEEAPEEVKPLADSLNDLLERLKTALDAQRAFVADAAHELRTPLAALQLQAQLVERAQSDAERRAALGDMKEGLRRAAHGVRQLLTLARQEPGAAEARFAPVRLAWLARESVAGHSALAAARRIDLGVSHSEEDAVISGDADALKILLDNLIANALRHAPEGGRIDVACGTRDGAAYCEVADDGPGIPPEERERVFDRFYRRDCESGAGLGLAIVRTIARRHGATVCLLDSDAGGLLARVEFPLGRE
ncbi:MAG: HAMP domain-containing protein [Candidatus Accumulibacter sp.]|jgi:two-component system OmpR family sensor kinase|nr:HAMP domain-containing protein [Accumulibacter sp.]